MGHAIRKTIAVVTMSLVTVFCMPRPVTAAEPAGIHGPSAQDSSQAPKPDLAALAGEGKWLELMAASSDAAGKNTSNPGPLAYLLQAIRMLGESDAALKRADEAVARFPDDAHILLERAWIHSFRGDWRQALSDARRATEIEPKLYDALIVQGIACREIRDWDNTVATFSKALALRPDDPTAWLNRGRSHVEKEMWQEGLADLDKSLSLDRKSAEAFYHRGRAYAGSGALADAAKDFTTAIRLSPEAIAPYIARAEVLSRGGHWEAAARDAYTAITLGSRDTRPFFTGCQASIALGDFEALDQYAAGGIGIDPDNPEFHRFAGRALREKGDLDRALKAYDQAIKLATQNAGILLDRAMTCLMLGCYRQAADDCTASLTAKFSSTAYALRAFARLKEGALDAALEDSTNALTLEPDEITALLVRANIGLLQGRTADALDDSFKALRLDPGQPWAYVTYGSALVKDFRCKEGLEMLDQALEMAPGDSEALLARGRCLEGLGRMGDAAKDFEKAAADPLFKKAAMEELGKLQAR